MTDLRQVVARAINQNVPNYGVADRVLAALSGAIGEDVKRAARKAMDDAWLALLDRSHGRAFIRDSWDELLQAAAPIIALAASEAALEEALQAIRNEHLEGPVDSEGDHAYDNAIDDAWNAVRALKSGGRGHG
jgi:hypothetical protein